jgi:KipI family sensor histidine kinase inhibitor
VAVRIRDVGEHALLVEVADPAGWFEQLRRARAEGRLSVREIIPGARTVLLDGLADPAVTAEQLRRWPPPQADTAAATGPPVAVPVRFDGPDLATVAELWQDSERAVIDRLTGIEFRVAFCGFSPGWSYLAGLPAELTVPRLATPRPRVPAGSVALGGPYAGIYPSASPGGWRLVGRSDIRLFDPDRDPPALLTPGTRVRLTERAEMPAPIGRTDMAGSEPAP